MTAHRQYRARRLLYQRICSRRHDGYAHDDTRRRRRLGQYNADDEICNRAAKLRRATYISRRSQGDFIIGNVAIRYYVAAAASIYLAADELAIWHLQSACVHAGRCAEIIASVRRVATDAKLTRPAAHRRAWCRQRHRAMAIED